MVSRIKSHSNFVRFPFRTLFFFYFFIPTFLISQQIENLSTGRQAYLNSLNKKTVVNNDVNTYPPSYGEAFAGIERYEYISDLQTVLDYDNQTLTIRVSAAISNPDNDERDYGAGEYVNAWLDFNENGIFEENEQVIDQLKYAKGTDIVDTLTFVEVVDIPENAPPETWMRVVLGYGYDPEPIDSWYFGSARTQPVELIIRLTKISAPLIVIPNSSNVQEKSTYNLSKKLAGPELTLKQLKNIDPYYDFYGDKQKRGQSLDWNNGDRVKNARITYTFQVNGNTTIGYSIYKSEGFSWQLLKIFPNKNVKPGIETISFGSDFLTKYDPGFYKVKIYVISEFWDQHLDKPIAEINEYFTISRDRYFVDDQKEVQTDPGYVIVGTVNKNIMYWIGKFLVGGAVSIAIGTAVSIYVIPTIGTASLVAWAGTAPGIISIGAISLIPVGVTPFYLDNIHPAPPGWQSKDGARYWNWKTKHMIWEDGNYKEYKEESIGHWKVERTYRWEIDDTYKKIGERTVDDGWLQDFPATEKWPYPKYPVYGGLEDPRFGHPLNQTPEHKPDKLTHDEIKWSDLKFDGSNGNNAIGLNKISNYSNFSYQFSDTGIDLDGNGLYEYLTVNITTDVNAEGLYRFAGMLTDKTDTNKIISATNDNFYMAAGSQIISLDFPGEHVNQSGISGSYLFNIQVADSNWLQLDFQENIYQTSNYQSEKFESPSIQIGDLVESYGLDKDKKGKYESLIYKIGIESETSDKFLIQGTISKDDSSLSFIRREISLQLGNNTVELKFPGSDISKTGLDGPYNLSNVYLMSEDSVGFAYKRIIGQSPSYSASDFELPNLSFTNIFLDQGVDFSGDGYLNILWVKTSASVEKEGKYYLSGTLADSSGNLITLLADSVELATGTQEINLNFSGRDIYDNGVDGPYVLNSLSVYSPELNFHTSSSLNVYQTEAYQANQFQPPDIFLTGGFAEEPIDSDNDGIFDQLKIEFNVQTVKAQKYSIFGSLLSGERIGIATDDSTSLFPVSNSKITLYLDGESINRKRINGPYNLDVTIFDLDGNLISAYPNTYQTNQYTTNQFIAPKAIFTDIYSDVGYDANENSLFDSLFTNIEIKVNEQGYYSFTGDLVDTDGYKIDTDVHRTYLDVGEQSFRLSFDGMKIFRNGINGPYYLANLSIYNAGSSNWPLLSRRSLADSTGAYEYTEFEKDTTSGPTDVKKEKIQLPTQYILHQNYPNPFNPTTTINYSIPKSNRIEHVLLEIYNTLGEKIATLVDTQQKPGIYSVEWNGRDDSFSEVTSGVYLLRLKTDSYISVKKMIFLR